MARSHLNNGRVKVGDLRELVRQDLLRILDGLTGTKVLIWDECLTGPVGLIAEYSVLKEHEVTKMFPLKGGALPPINADNVVFIVRPVVEACDAVASNIKTEERRGGSGNKKDYHCLFLPKKSLLCEKRLKGAGVFGSLTLWELPAYFFPLDNDLLSMELPGSFREYQIEGDPTSLHYAAKALTQLQTVCGLIPRIYGKGVGAAQLFELLVRMRREMAGMEPTVKPQVDTLVILDRAVDLLSTLPTQLTYEGLIDEMFGIQQSSVRLPADKFSQQQQTKGGDQQQAADTKQIVFSSAEEMYAEIRGLNFNAVGPTLSRKARNISAQFEERHEAKTVGEMKLFVERLPQMQAAKLSLATHTSIAELVKERIDCQEFLEILEIEQEILAYVNSDRYLEAIEDLACKEVSLNKLLRVICMQSLVSSGLKPKLAELYRRLVVQSYGYQHQLTLDNLERAGLLTLNTGQKTYASLRKRLNLISDTIDEQNPNDIGYVHSVYAPLSVRLVQQLEKPGWRNIRDVLDMLPGPSFEDTQQLPASLPGLQRSGESKVVLVMFLGGCTMAEVAALRFLSQQEDSGVEYLVATTSIITGSTFIQSLATTLEAPLF